MYCVLILSPLFHYSFFFLFRADRLEELKQYKAEHGNCRVRAGKVREGTFSSLGKVSVQLFEWRIVPNLP